MNWISITDKLPDFDSPEPIFRLESKPVLVWLSFGKICVATLEENEDEPEIKMWYTNDSEHWDITESVLYWMPLPDGPDTKN